VRTDIEPHAGARQRLLAPGVRLALGAEAVEVRLVGHDAAHRAFRYDFVNGLEITGVTAVLIDRHDPLLARRGLHQIFGFRHGGGERLVHHDVPAGEEALLGDRMVGRVGRRDDDDVERPLQQLVDAADELDVFVERIRLAVALHDRRQAHAVDRANDGGMKDLAREAEADEPDVDQSGRGVFQSLVMMNSGAPSNW